LGRCITGINWRRRSLAFRKRTILIAIRLGRILKYIVRPLSIIAEMSFLRIRRRRLLLMNIGHVYSLSASTTHETVGQNDCEYECKDTKTDSDSGTNAESVVAYIVIGFVQVTNPFSIGNRRGQCYK